jgi:signal transduction histidine kinase
LNSKVNILLVDDEARNLDVLESTLQSEDYHLVRSLTADHALLALIDGDFAAIVLDIQMPDMSGFELANIIKQRKRTRHIPILFLTAYYQDDKDVLEGYGTGAVDYLTKPINPQILRSKIAVFVDLYRKSRALLVSNQALEQEIGRRQSAEEALRQLNNDLEMRVEERTSDLIRVNGELREREKELATARDRALAASRAKDDFVARLSHELRTPLNPVLMIASDAAANPALPDEVRADFETIAENVSLEARLIDDLLDITGISQGKLTLTMRPFEFNTVIHDAIGMVRGEVVEKRIDMKIQLRAKNRLVLGDDVRLRQVFWNVLKNAVKFTPPCGMVTVETDTIAANGNYVARITDTGIGMTSQELGRAFDAFSQGDHATTAGAHRFGGLGLGLAISRMLVELHHGSIRATSTGRNRGAVFEIDLPLAPAPERANGSASPAHAPFVSEPSLPPRRRRILLVEDHAATCEALQHLLVRRNYDVVSASCLTDARAIAAREDFDILISDIGLPDGSGCDLMSELRDRTGVVGVALTGYGMEDDVSRCLAAGFKSHLTKPVSAQELDRVVRMVLSLSGE